MLSFIIGDFNCPDINWEQNEASTDDINLMLVSCMSKLGLTQFINEPTRGNNILDLCFSNDAYFVADVNVSCPFGSSDHSSIVLTLLLKSIEDYVHMLPTDNKYCRLSTAFNWSNANYDAINSVILSIDWCSILSVHLSADSLWAAFCQAILSVICDYVPRNVQIPRNSSRAKKYNRQIRKKLSEKLRLYRCTKRMPSCQRVKMKYKRVARDCRDLIKGQEVLTENNVIRSGNIGCFYRYVNNRLSCRKGIGPLKSANGALLSTELDKANALNAFFWLGLYYRQWYSATMQFEHCCYHCK